MPRLWNFGENEEQHTITRSPTADENSANCLNVINCLKRKFELMALIVMEFHSVPDINTLSSAELTVIFSYNKSESEKPVLWHLESTRSLEVPNTLTEKAFLERACPGQPAWTFQGFRSPLFPHVSRRAHMYTKGAACNCTGCWWALLSVSFLKNKFKVCPLCSFT